MVFMTEDEVRQSASIILGLDKKEDDIIQGVGQVTTFKQLGLTKGSNLNLKPDGWYLPANRNMTAIILETKASDKDISRDDSLGGLKDYYQQVRQEYDKVISIYYNGKEVRVFNNETEVVDTPSELQPKEYYIKQYTNQRIDKDKIYTSTRRINNLLHHELGVSSLNQRMILTACSLVAKRFGANIVKGMSFDLMKLEVKQKLEAAIYNTNHNINLKLKTLVQVFERISPQHAYEPGVIDEFIEHLGDISDSIESDHWNGEDVMGIFFNEFNRYKSKSDLGQVFTPDHITSLMARLIEIDEDDRVLDAAAGSGAFVIKSMSMMVEQAGGDSTQKANEIKANQIYAIEYDEEIFALLAANFLLHKDGKTNIELMDSRSEAAGEWIASKDINKVLMNPPYERKYGSMKIVENVLNNVKKGALCAFLLPDKHLEKHMPKNMLKKHKLKKIIKIPEETFDEGVVTSIFIFEAGKPQNNEDIYTLYIEEDGLVRQKNQGRQDVHNTWKDIENHWVNVIKKQEMIETAKWVSPNDCLSYQVEVEETEVTESDFKKTMMDYIMFQRGIDVDEFNNRLKTAILYHSQVTELGDNINITLEKQEEGEQDE